MNYITSMYQVGKNVDLLVTALRKYEEGITQRTIKLIWIVVA